MTPPFIRESQLFNGLDACLLQDLPDESLPSHPLIQLSDSVGVLSCLEKSCVSADLEAAASSLWILSTQSGANISPLHHQRVKGRQIVITEDPGLHLVWIHNRIFLKPIPRYLLSFPFWERFLSEVPNVPPTQDQIRLQRIRQAALGFLRSYSHLITSETDFILATDPSLRLLPDNVDWHQACRFLASLITVPDDAVSQRYHYGELRLTRLNFYAPFLFHRFSYVYLRGQYSDYFGQFYGTILFAFAVITTFLNALQLGVGVEQIHAQWAAFRRVSRWVSVIALVGTTILTIGLLGLWLGMYASEWLFALRIRRGRGLKRVHHC